MTCEKAFDRYLELDKNERVPLGVTLHLLRCPVCRTSVRALTRSEVFLASSLEESSVDFKVEDPIVAEALTRIKATGFLWEAPPVQDKHVSLFRWIVSGLVLGGGFALVPSSSIGIWSQGVFGTSFSIPFYLMCGMAITTWCGMFVGSNIDFFVKKFGIKRFA
ncbi:MAG TPA: hypothetical protein VJ861_06345 [Treponemataceae bacterium]|nr:hypothetical protein [Treponemataceae bacterium]